MEYNPTDPLAPEPRCSCGKPPAIWVGTRKEQPRLHKRFYVCNRSEGMPCNFVCWDRIARITDDDEDKKRIEALETKLQLMEIQYAELEIDEKQLEATVKEREMESKVLRHEVQKLKVEVELTLSENGRLNQSLQLVRMENRRLQSEAASTSA